MKLLASLFLILSLTAVNAQEKKNVPTPPNRPAELSKPVEQAPKQRLVCHTIEGAEAEMKRHDFVKFFMAKPADSDKYVIFWKNESKNVIIVTTFFETEGVYIACMNSVLLRVREFGPV